MFHLTLVMADTLIIATGTDDKWIGACQDLHRGKIEKFEWDCEQLAAVIALAMAGDDLPVEDVQLGLRKIACPLVADWASEVNPIP